MYIILELQTDNEGHTSNIVTTKTDKNEALSTFNSIMAAAWLSDIRYHTAMIIDPVGRVLKRDCAEHIPPEPEPESEEIGDSDEIIS